MRSLGIRRPLPAWRGLRRWAVETLIRLGFNLIPLGREAETAAYLESALHMVRQLGEQAQEIRSLLHLETARQYLGVSRHSCCSGPGWPRQPSTASAIRCIICCTTVAAVLPSTAGSMTLVRAWNRR